MLGSRANFKLQGLAVDFDNRLWSKDARHRIFIYPDLWLLVAGQALSSSSTSSLFSSRSPGSTRWPVAGGGSSGPAAFFSLCFPAACGRCSIRALSPLRRHWPQVVQMEGDSRRLPRCAGGQLNLWPQLAQLEQWIELRALSVSVSALTACALPPPPRENFLKNVHIQRGRLGCRVASFSRWRLFLANP